MIGKDTTFTLAEISEACGINRRTLEARAKQLREAGVLPKNEKRYKTVYYTYEQALKIIAKPKTTNLRKPRKSHIDLLKRQLMTDGYPINKGPKKEATA